LSIPSGAPGTPQKTPSLQDVVNNRLGEGAAGKIAVVVFSMCACEKGEE
jgi:hypothetical protein